MAEVRLLHAKGVFDVARKISNRNILKTPKKQGKSAIHASSLFAGLHLVDNNNDKDVGVSPDSYTRVNQKLFSGKDNWKNSFVVGYDPCHGLTSFSLSNKVNDCKERNIARYQNHTETRRTLFTPRTARRHLSWGHGHLVFIRAYSGNGTRDEPLYKTKTGYYDILEVTPSATHTQIKTAYYKQSFLYHPDRNAGSDEATVRFSEISEAYTVLGNKGLRKKYDRGLLSLFDLNATARPSSKGPAASSAKAQTDRSVVGADSQGGIFDFDKFFKSHYGEQLQREKDIRVRKEEMLKKKQESIGEKKMDWMMEMGIAVMLVMAASLIISLKR